MQNNKEADNDWFRLESNKEGTRWFGKCWYIHDMLKYEFDVEFDVSFSAFTVSVVLLILGKSCKPQVIRELWRMGVTLRI